MNEWDSGRPRRLNAALFAAICASRLLVGCASFTTGMPPLSYVPIGLRFNGYQSPATMTVDMCALNFSAHHADPSLTPFYRDLVVASGCDDASAVVRVPYTTLEEEYSVRGCDRADGRGVGCAPAGLVFHESRCGSTLVANMLAASTATLVVSESPVEGDLLAATGMGDFGDDAAVARVLRVLTSAYGRPIVGAASTVAATDSADAATAWVPQHFYIKQRSSVTPHLRLFRAAFPEVPWVFMHRRPRDVLASLFRHVIPPLPWPTAEPGMAPYGIDGENTEARGAPCLRAARSPAVTRVVRALVGVMAVGSAGDEGDGGVDVDGGAATRRGSRQVDGGGSSSRCLDAAGSGNASDATVAVPASILPCNCPGRAPRRWARGDTRRSHGLTPRRAVDGGPSPEALCAAVLAEAVAVALVEAAAARRAGLAASLIAGSRRGGRLDDDATVGSADAIPPLMDDDATVGSADAIPPLMDDVDTLSGAQVGAMVSGGFFPGVVIGSAGSLLDARTRRGVLADGVARRCPSTPCAGCRTCATGAVGQGLIVDYAGSSDAAGSGSHGIIDAIIDVLREHLAPPANPALLVSRGRAWMSEAEEARMRAVARLYSKSRGDAQPAYDESQFGAAVRGGNRGMHHRGGVPAGRAMSPDMRFGGIGKVFLGRSAGRDAGAGSIGANGNRSKGFSSASAPHGARGDGVHGDGDTGDGAVGHERARLYIDDGAAKAAAGSWPALVAAASKFLDPLREVLLAFPATTTSVGDAGGGGAEEGSLAGVDSDSRSPDGASSDAVPFDVRMLPLSGGYPATYPLDDILSSWNPDITSLPRHTGRYSSLRIFNGSSASDLHEASLYRRFEVPFIVRGAPGIGAAVAAWANDSYLIAARGVDNSEPYEAEISDAGTRFLYFNRGIAATMARQRSKTAGPSDSSLPASPPTTKGTIGMVAWLVAASAIDVATGDEERLAAARGDGGVSSDWLAPPERQGPDVAAVALTAPAMRDVGVRMPPSSWRGRPLHGPELASLPESSAIHRTDVLTARLTRYRANRTLHYIKASAGAPDARDDAWIARCETYASCCEWNSTRSRALRFIPASSTLQ